MFTAAPETADFAYAVGADDGIRARVAIFAQDEALRRRMLSDCAGAGLCGRDGGSLSALVDGAEVAVLGEVVLVDCPGEAGRGIGAMMLAGLARLEARVLRAGARLIVNTNLAGLDEVFAWLDRGQPEILVGASRAEVVLAVGRALSEAGASRVREMADGDRAALLRLSQQVEAIAQSLERLGQAGSTGVTEQTRCERAAGGVVGALCAATPRVAIAPALPDPQLVRRIIANRQARARFFDPALFGDPAWDMLLDLTAARAEGAEVSVTSLCIAAGVPATTALRWLTHMVESGLFMRLPDPLDRRRAFVALSDAAAAGMAAYFAQVEACAPVPALV